ncbi:MAG: hypothetical protein A4E41_01524 [Methanoregulaceae archaeon PtaU1.Bin066]|nr:MAG: hypothetical protein A4E41_01524 [Methanoregulaceae archaeon PtaU1.Bin066]
MVARDIVREERLDVHDDPPAILQDPDALVEDREELLKIPFPVNPVLARVVPEPEVVGRRGEHEVDAVRGERPQHLFAVPNDDCVPELIRQRILLSFEPVVERIVPRPSCLHLVLPASHLPFPVVGGIDALLPPDPVASHRVDPVEQVLEHPVQAGGSAPLLSMAADEIEDSAPECPGVEGSDVETEGITVNFEEEPVLPRSAADFHEDFLFIPGEGGIEWDLYQERVRLLSGGLEVPRSRRHIWCHHLSLPGQVRAALLPSRPTSIAGPAGVVGCVASRLSGGRSGMAIPQIPSSESGPAEEKYLQDARGAKGPSPSFPPGCSGALRTWTGGSRHVSGSPQEHYFRTNERD